MMGIAKQRKEGSFGERKIFSTKGRINPESDKGS